MAFNSEGATTSTSTGNVKIKIEPNQQQENDLETSEWVNELIDFTIDTNDEEKRTNYEATGDIENENEVEEVLMKEFFQPFSDKIVAVGTSIKNRDYESNDCEDGKNTRINGSKEGNTTGNVDEPRIEPIINLDLDQIRMRYKQNILLKLRQAEAKSLENIHNSKLMILMRNAEAKSLENIHNSKLMSESTSLKPIETSTTMETSRDESLFYCTCQLGFLTEGLLKVHKITSPLCKDTLYKCQTCSELFLTKEHWRHHKISHLKLQNGSTTPPRINPYNRKHCKKLIEEGKKKKAETKRSKNTNSNISISNKGIFKCTYCKMKSSSFEQLERLNDHIIKFHTYKGEHYRCDSSSRECGCGRIFISKGDLSIHKNLHQNNQPLTYHEQLKLVKNNLGNDITKKDSNLVPESTNVKPIMLIRELKANNGSRPPLPPRIKPSRDGFLFYCTTCGCGFPTEDLLIVHETTSSTCKVTLYQCQICSKSFRNEANLKAHKISHSKSQDRTATDTIQNTDSSKHLFAFQCSECQEKFATVSLLNKHLKKLHSRDRTLAYCRCGRGFLNEALLEVHKIASPKPTCKIPQFHSRSPNRLLLKCSDCEATFTKVFDKITHYRKFHEPTSSTNKRKKTKSAKRKCKANKSSVGYIFDFKDQ